MGQEKGLDSEWVGLNFRSAISELEMWPWNKHLSPLNLNLLIFEVGRALLTSTVRIKMKIIIQVLGIILNNYIVILIIYWTYNMLQALWW